jgi:flagellar motor switch/type III secretory pathway protein FliN
LPKFSKHEVAISNGFARWLGGWRQGERLATLVGTVQIRMGRQGANDAKAFGDGLHADPFAARCEVRVRGEAIAVAGSSGAVRAIAQRLLGGPDELDAPRPLTIAERSVFALLVAAALEDLGVPGEAWPVLEPNATVAAGSRTSPPDAPTGPPSPIGAHAVMTAGDTNEAMTREVRVVLDVDLGGRPMTIAIAAPGELVMRAPPRPGPWVDATYLDLVVAVARCGLSRVAIDALAVGDVVIVERAAGGLELELGEGGVGVRAIPGAVVGTVATEYVPRDMALPDDAHLELTVALGTTRLSLRALSELAIGQTVPLGRPVGGPYELRAGGTVIGRGELVDVDGELGVRIVSLGESA